MMSKSYIQMMFVLLIIIVILPPYMEIFKALSLYLGMNLNILRFDKSIDNRRIC